MGLKNYGYNMKYIVERIVGVKDNAEVVKRNITKKIEDVEKYKEELLNFYDSIGVKLDFIDIEYKEYKYKKRGGRKFKHPPQDVFRYYTSNPDKTLEEIGKEFGISKQLTSKYITRMLKNIKEF